MIQSAKQVVTDLVALCVSHDVHHVILTPGSRNAPLMIAFANHPEITCYSVIDERSAAFIALGLSQAKRCPVAICCTSGSALLNYYPAVAEAYYQCIPLVVLSADRPPEWIDQQDGQTIRQSHVMQAHVRKSVNLTVDQEDEVLSRYNRRLINEALIRCLHPIAGPVHINIPLREPLYQTTAVAAGYELKPILSISRAPQLADSDWEALATCWENATNVMLLLGMAPVDKQLHEGLQRLDSFEQVVIWNETTANYAVNYPIEKIIATTSEEEFKVHKPDLLITMGEGIVSKRLKQWLRKYPPLYHWHVNKGGEVVDTYQALTHVIDIDAGHFLVELAQRIDSKPSAFKQFWVGKRVLASDRHTAFLSDAPYSDLKVFYHIDLCTRRHDFDLHSGNSSVIRYVQLMEFPQVELHFCNRGTSGIDGIASTAVGYAYASGRQTLLIIGDISFWYDINAYNNAYLSPHLRIILINNEGGNIFRLIEGPQKGGIVDPYQETPHNRSAADICRTFGLSYSFVDNENDMIKALEELFHSSDSPKLLEIKTPRLNNPIVWKAYFNFLANGKST